MLWGSGLEGKANFKPGTWNQVVVTRSHGVLSLYVNARLAGRTSIGTLSAAVRPILIGARNISDGRNLSMGGSIDEVGLWNRALSNTEISQLNTAGFQTSSLNTAWLMAAGLVLFLFICGPPRRSYLFHSGEFR
ncbi:MAG: LamG domain-containing protein [Bryobacteraceae bacterium]|nr:LamG domain-containing protein [Bryobacteraceae bacterium]